MISEAATIETDILGYLAGHEQKELCRFVTVGSVDDGKSTLIGRLLHDTHGIYEDQLAAVVKASVRKKDDEIDFSLFTDGLKAEREQGITIDVAYRYFSTDKRKFIIADTPGHVQYTRNMATGASTADVAIILLDARLGVLPQSRRHAYIASLLGIRQLLVAVNKMDLVDYQPEVFHKLSAEFGAFGSKLGFAGITFFPISAKKGDNVVTPSERTPWFTGGTMLQFLETVPVARDRSAEKFRHAVQYVLRPHLDYRGFAGRIASGVVRRGDEVVVLPSGRRSRIKGIDLFEGEVAEAFAPQSVALRLEDEVDISRGDMIAHVSSPPIATRRFDAMVVWMSERPWDPTRALLVKHTTRMVPARVERIHHRTDLETLSPEAASTLSLNDIAKVTIRCNRPIFCDPYRENRVTGAFILIDALSNDTVGAGMICDGELTAGGGDFAGEFPLTDRVSDRERQARLGQSGGALFLPSADLGHAVERLLYDRGRMTLFVDAATLSTLSLSEIVVRTVSAGLAVVLIGAPIESRTQLSSELGSTRVLDHSAAVASDVPAIAQAMGQLCDLADLPST